MFVKVLKIPVRHTMRDKKHGNNTLAIYAKNTNTEEIVAHGPYFRRQRFRFVPTSSSVCFCPRWSLPFAVSTPVINTPSPTPDGQPDASAPSSALEAVANPGTDATEPPLELRPLFWAWKGGVKAGDRFVRHGLSRIVPCFPSTATR